MLEELRILYLTKLTPMIRISREMVQALARLPLLVKFSIGLALLVEFIVITQWERLPFTQPLAPAALTVAISPKKPEQRSFNFADTPHADKGQQAAAETALVKRIGRMTVEEPTVQPNGSIIGGGRTIYLYGIKQSNSKALCTRASGERWACGLHAYAALRNAIAKKSITCDPKKLLPSGVSAKCYLGSSNVALTLVREGLAELDDNIDDADMVKAQDSAKKQKLGIWDR